MKLGYAHIPSSDQSADQLKALQRAGCQKLFTDHGAFGVTNKRPELLRCLQTLRSGDSLVVWRLDRLARNVTDLLVIVEDLQSRRINLLSLTEGLSTSTSSGPAIFQTFAALRAFERNKTIGRMQAGMESAKARGVRTGPKPKLTREKIDYARKLIEEGQRREDVAGLLKVSRVTLYRALVA